MKLKNVNFIVVKIQFLDDVDIDKKLIPNEAFFGKENYEYFIGYEDDDYKISPLYIIFPKMSGL